MLKFSIRMLWFVAFVLVAFGVMVVSYAGKSQGQETYHFFFMQAAFAVIGLGVALIAYHVPYHFYRKPVVLWGIVGAMLFALALVLVPGIGKGVKGAHRWISLGPISVQPVEFVKLLIVVFLSGYLDRLGGRVRKFKAGVLVPGVVIGAVLLCLILQPDFGGAMVVCALSGITLLVGGVSWKWCACAGVLGVVVIALFVALNPNRMARLRKEQQGENYQAKQSETAFRNGEIFGKGLGVGMQREKYLPECHTDFIFAVIGEDFGLVGTASIVLLFLLILFGGTVIALHAPDKQGMLLAFGATLILCAQGAANMAVVTHLFPTKGLALPFLSYGGSCLLASFATMGTLLGVGKIAVETEENPELSAPRLVSLDE